MAIDRSSLKRGSNPGLNSNNRDNDSISKYNEQIRMKREQELEALRNKKKKMQEELDRKRRVHIFISSVIIVLTLSTIIAIYPTPAVSIACILLICVFFCIGVSYQRAISQLLILAVCAIAVVQIFYFMMN